MTHTKAQTHIHTHNPPTYTPHTQKLTHTISEHVTKTKMILSRRPGISVHPKLDIHFFNYMGMDNAKHIKHNGFRRFQSFGLSQAGSPPPLVAWRILTRFCETLTQKLHQRPYVITHVRGIGESWLDVRTTMSRKSRKVIPDMKMAPANFLNLRSLYHKTARTVLEPRSRRLLLINSFF